MLCRRSAKLRSLGRLAKAGGRAPAGIHGPLASGAASQPPLLKRYQVLVDASLNTSQLVFTANDSVVLAMGAITGSPSKTTRLAGRSLTKMRGGALSTAAGACGGEAGAAAGAG